VPCVPCAPCVPGWLPPGIAESESVILLRSIDLRDRMV
jgi:hypothetical protein